MADAIFTGHKDHCHWRNPGDLLRVLSSEAGQVCGGETERFCRFADGGLQVCIDVSRFRVIQQVATGLDVFRFIHLCESLLNVLPHAINRRRPALYSVHQPAYACASASRVPTDWCLQPMQSTTPVQVWVHWSK